MRVKPVSCTSCGRGGPRANYSPAYPYLVGGYYYAQPTPVPVVQQAVDVGTAWPWLLVVLLLVILGFILYSKRAR